ncbi:MAG: riboflavin synthase subunit alpha [Pseudomonadales bacterium]|nr:riboflavin synthase subunit alpha [Pseudomonadales bacterium]
MYTGIVQALLPVETVERKPGLMTFSIRLPAELLPELTLGASVAINGTCFTVTTIDADQVWFDAIAETLAITNISELTVGSLVNVERSAKADAEIGGHILSGHIIGTAPVAEITDSENNRRLTFEGDPAWMKYVFTKGFLALNGASLTIAAVDGDKFSVNLIPETMKRTNFGLMQMGDRVNVEIDQQTQAVVDTVERVMAERFPAS